MKNIQTNKPPAFTAQVDGLCVVRALLADGRDWYGLVDQINDVAAVVIPLDPRLVYGKVIVPVGRLIPGGVS